jgi:CheY-like chemotaxis protein
MRNAVGAMAASDRRELEVKTCLFDDETVEIAVADSGPGLPSAVADHLFEPFVTTKRNGMGLGLSICRSIIEAHGGRLRANPAPTEGHSRQKGGPWPLNGPSMWYDDAAVRRSLERLLDSAGLHAMSYETSLAFLDAAPNLLPGCLLLDVKMPGMDGLELQAVLRQSHVLIPVIIMTGHGDVQSAVRAMKNGAVDFIEKPYSDDVLLRAIEAALARVDRADLGHETAEAAKRIATLTPREIKCGLGEGPSE